MEFFLRRLKLTYILEKHYPETPSSEVATNEATLIKEQIAKLQDDEYLCKNYFLGGMSNKYYNQYCLKCKFSKEIRHLQIEQEARYRDNNILKEPIMKAHVVEEKSIKKEPTNNKSSKARKRKNFKHTYSNSKSNECYHCLKIGQYACDCKILKGEKKKERANNNTKN
ncbi:hypothetical protein H5410_022030 [Solanum commersonii]|uniref:Uncharacterized protein n=1 Tax=Solanum commersonii TaxID=4109 RepID=A0A9J5ZE86_SOLCO|nr:hypothetical protein H5410_022030 [Solanum commersonii]